MPRKQQLQSLLQSLEVRLETLLQKYLKAFERRMDPIMQAYLEHMGEHIRDIGRLSATDVHRLAQLRRMNRNLNAIQKAIAEAASLSADDVEEAFWSAASLIYDVAADHFGGSNGLPIRENSAIVRILEAQLRVTQNSFVNLSQTTIVSTGYQNAIDRAVQTVQTGLTSYTSAIRRAMREAAAQGLRVRYPSGWTRRLDTAVRQNVLDGVRSLNQAVLNQVGEEFGADGVEITAHALCAEDHLPYQGRQFSSERFHQIQSELKRPFGQWNCRHMMFPVILGISVPAFDQRELEQYRAHSQERITIDDQTMTRYQWTQEQRRIETAVRQQKDIAVCAKAAGDSVLRREVQRNINDLLELYERVSNQAGLLEQRERMRVSGFRNVKATKALQGSNLHAIMAAEQNRAWLLQGYKKAVSKGDLSAFTGFEHYMQVAQRVESELVGLVTSQGLVISGYKTHFIDRIIGSYEEKREPVDISDVKSALVHPDKIEHKRPADGEPSDVYRGSHCWVSVNPNSAMLIQTSPKKKGGF